MGGGLMAAKACDSCKSATATVFCRADSAYLCIGCDCKIHAANKLASRHARVWVCEVCEHAPASVTCKADAAHLCSTCDRDVHSANPLARRHERVPLTPFFDSSLSDSNADADAEAAAKSAAAISKLFGDDYYSDADEAEAASWLLHNPNPNPNSSCNKAVNNNNNNKSSMEYLLSGGGAGDGDDIDPYLDLDFGADPRPDPSSDGVVPDPDQKQQQQSLLYSMPADANAASHYHHLDSFNCKPYSLSYNPATTQPSLSHSVSSSSLEYGVVPEAAITSGMGEGASTTMTIRVGLGGQQQQQEQEQMKVLGGGGGGGGGISGMDREARVLRYREKRKNRKFEKTIRYASRKAYAETRPRIKGRFAKRTDIDPSYGVVPSF